MKEEECSVISLVLVKNIFTETVLVRTIVLLLISQREKLSRTTVITLVLRRSITIGINHVSMNVISLLKPQVPMVLIIVTILAYLMSTYSKTVVAAHVTVQT